MVYPVPAAEELDRILKMSGIYRTVGLRVAEIYDRIEDRALLLEDLGNHSLQYHLKRSGIKERMVLIAKAAKLLEIIASIPAELTVLHHDRERQCFEMNFFIDHFLSKEVKDREKEDIRGHLHLLTEKTSSPIQFAHRDFHSRNLVYSQGPLGIVDFQDSMRAHPLYDLASFFWDAYIPWTQAQRSAALEAIPTFAKTNRSDLEAVALQRTIKALGTFAFQVKVKKHLAYARFIPRVSTSILQNPQLERFLPKSLHQIFHKDHWRKEHDHQ